MALVRMLRIVPNPHGPPSRVGTPRARTRRATSFRPMDSARYVSKMKCTVSASSSWTASRFFPSSPCTMR
ncbi:MAG: hypothetical protein DYG93_00850 [Leptolyngbya sp. PLA2]|nr:hypothetical protein [Leptolyngbya sp. PL-A2]